MYIGGIILCCGCAFHFNLGTNSIPFSILSSQKVDCWSRRTDVSFYCLDDRVDNCIIIFSFCRLIQYLSFHPPPPQNREKVVPPFIVFDLKVPTELYYKKYLENSLDFFSFDFGEGQTNTSNTPNDNPTDKRIGKLFK